MKFKKQTAAYILHISDLHIRNIEDAATWRGQLADDLKIEFGRHRLDALVISGDIADKSPPGEYEVAGKFLKNLAGDFGLPLTLYKALHAALQPPLRPSG